MTTAKEALVIAETVWPHWTHELVESLFLSMSSTEEENAFLAGLHEIKARLTDGSPAGRE